MRSTGLDRSGGGMLVDMGSPGIEVRPLRTITGEAEFSELFFTDVRVPASALLGPVNEGWRVATTTLSHERGTRALEREPLVAVALERLKPLIEPIEGAGVVLRLPT